MLNFRSLAAASLIAGILTAATLYSHAAAPGAAAAPPTAKAPANDSPEDLNPLKLLAVPATQGSAECRAELALVHQLESSRTDADVARIREENILSIESFAAVTGPWLNPEKCPKLDILMSNIDLSVNGFNNSLKPVFSRPRPEAADATLKPVFHETDGSYPSGHSVRSTVYAIILAELMPDLKDKLMERAEAIGWDRVLAGMHYPSDVYAGRILGQAMARVLLADPRVQAGLKVAQAEIAAARPAK